MPTNKQACQRVGRFVVHALARGLEVGQSSKYLASSVCDCVWGLQRGKRPQTHDAILSSSGDSLVGWAEGNDREDGVLFVKVCLHCAHLSKRGPIKHKVHQHVLDCTQHVPSVLDVHTKGSSAGICKLG